MISLRQPASFSTVRGMESNSRPLPRAATPATIPRVVVARANAKIDAVHTNSTATTTTSTVRDASSSSSSSSSSSLLSAVALSLALLLSQPHLPRASASLLELPASRLQNTYWLVRTGESVAESAGRCDTNRATKQGTGAALSPLGARQVAEGALPVVSKRACGGGCFVYYGTVRRSEQVAAAIGAAAGLSQSRLIPEFSFLDPRGLGAFEGGQLPAVLEEVALGDSSTPLYRPPMGTTGTPNESVADVLTRVTQLVSASETKHRGEDVVIVFPDAWGPGVLQAAVAGEDLRLAESLAPPAGGVERLRLAPSTSPSSAVLLGEDDSSSSSSNNNNNNNIE